MELKERLDYIRKCIISIDELLKEQNSEKIINSFILLAAVLYILQTSIQALIDIGLRFLAELGIKPPTTYGQIGELLKKEKVFTEYDANLFRKIVGFRNVVRQYIRVNMSLVKKILDNRLYYDILKLAIKILEKAEEVGIDP